MLRPALAILLFALGPSVACAAEPVFVGVDANYSIAMEKEGRVWKWDGQQTELFQGIARSGVRGLRVRLWTKEEGQNGKAYATEVVRRGIAAGLEPYLVIFLSEDWADLMKQPAPAAWKDLDLEKRAEAVHAYSRDVVSHFRREGLRSHLYEIGNEIDYGICGVYPGKSTKKSPESLSRSCWPQAARLILASQQGVKEADPEAKFLLHIAHWWDVDFCIAFFKFMLSQGVQVDYAGLSYFPSSNIGGSIEMAQFGDAVSRLHEAIDRPVIVSETAYPATADFTGQFSRWKKESPGYPLTADGQRCWIADFLNFCAHRSEIAAVYYWSPEWCGEGMWKAFALFDVDGNARPAWQAFAAARAERPALKECAYFEIRGGKLHPVPLDKARAQTAALLAQKLDRAGRVNTDYIKDITETDLVVDGYRVALRASLSGNIDLSLVEGAEPSGDWKSVLSKMAVGKRAVVFVADETDPLVAQLQAFTVERGMEVIIHPQPIDRPLKFGLATGVVSDSAE